MKIKLRMSKELENRLRTAITMAEWNQDKVQLTVNDAKRLLYRLKKENSQVNKLVYRGKSCKSS